MSDPTRETEAAHAACCDACEAGRVDLVPYVDRAIAWDRERTQSITDLTQMRAALADLASEYDAYAGNIFPRVVEDLRAILSQPTSVATS